MKFSIWKWLMRNKECYAVHVVIAGVTMHVVFHDNIFDVGFFNTLIGLWCNQWLILNRIQCMTYNYETGWALWVGGKKSHKLHSQQRKVEVKYKKDNSLYSLQQIFIYYRLVFIFYWKGIWGRVTVKIERVG